MKNKFLVHVRVRFACVRMTSTVHTYILGHHSCRCVYVCSHAHTQNEFVPQAAFTPCIYDYCFDVQNALRDKIMCVHVRAYM